MVLQKEGKDQITNANSFKVTISLVPTFNLNRKRKGKLFEWERQYKKETVHRLERERDLKPKGYRRGERASFEVMWSDQKPRKKRQQQKETRADQ